MMDPLSSPVLLLQKNADLLEGMRILMLEPESGAAVTALARTAEQVSVFTSDCRVRDQLESWAEADEQNTLCFGFGAQTTAPEHDLAIVFLQKSKPRTDMLLQQALQGLNESGRLLLVGANKAGIKSWGKRIEKLVGSVEKVDSARHCVLFAADRPDEVAAFDIEQWFEVNQLEQADLEVHSLPGVFSHGRLDVGTRLLLGTMETRIKGHVLDFGCGAGVVAAAVGKKYPNTKLTMVDISELALESSRRTLAANGVEGQVQASDGLGNIKGRFDLIISNPPFHEGISTRYDTTENFIRASRRFLKPRGEFRIVANNFLQYPAIIKEVYGHCEVLASGDGFNVYQARA
ncbi:methyltransferase [Endozoicomonadaceae bacterium StTr2]